MLAMTEYLFCKVVFLFLFCLFPAAGTPVILFMNYVVIAVVAKYLLCSRVVYRDVEPVPADSSPFNVP